MLSASVTLAVLLGALAVFAAAGLRGGRRHGGLDRDTFLTARRSQGPGPLALSFFASVLGTWILLSPAEIGTFAGLLGVAGYAVGQAAALGVFAVLGPRVAERLPAGTTILEWVRRRFGRTMQAYAGAVSVLYMFVFLAAELTGIGLVVGLVSGVDPWVPIVAVTGVTMAYVTYGGLPASIYTDRWQAWLTLGLAAVGVVALGTLVDDPVSAARRAGLGDATRTGAEVGAVLIIAIVAANLFHQGFWQRVWAARDRRAIVRGSLFSALLVLPLLGLTGFAGMVAAGLGTLEEPSTAFFSLLDGAPWPLLALVVALAVTLACSTADTLENALASLAAGHVAGGRLGVGAARWITVAMTIPAAAVALRGLSVLRLFLIADLLAATIAVPVFAGLWRRATATGALAGAASGLAAVVALGWVRQGSLGAGLWLLTLPDGPTIGPFLAAPLVSAAVTFAVSGLGTRREPAPAPG